MHGKPNPDTSYLYPVNKASYFAKMKGRKIMGKRISLLIVVFSIFNAVFAQDSLYLVNTLVGETDNQLLSAKAAGDINGDGYADLAVSFEDSTYIYLGNPDFELKPDYLFQYGFYINTGDINNDGYDDYIILHGENDYNEIKSFKLHFGGEELDSTGILIHKTEKGGFYYIFSDKVNPIGDVNGDGYNDFVISIPYNWDNGISYVYLYLGGDSISSEPFVTFERSPFIDPNSEHTFGDGVTGIWDQNNDGYDDLLISDPGYADTVGAKGSGRVYLYYGGSEMDNVEDSILIKNNEKYFGNEIKRLLINKNGNFKFAITSIEKVHFYDNLLDEPFSIDGKKFGLGGYVSVGIGGDINGDGYNDFLIGNTNYRNKSDIMVGGSFLYYGNSGNDTLYDYKFEGEHKWDEFSKQQDIIGDFNGDGYDDFFIIAPSYPDYNNPKGKLYLYSYKKYMTVEDLKNKIFSNFELIQNYPNPFNNITIIPFYLNKASKININIYDIRGQLITSLFSGLKQTGMHKITWNGKTNAGKEAASGVYFVVLKQKNSNLNIYSQKIVLLK
ncbi:MAG: T9SS C-terminal target domain-containing protein [Calditrichaeota bacterium]|nr:MAG: T9SS C-terminal target domain-containing protein [Calditrichota bacterium]